jgi:hypothetical protein
MSSRLLAAAAAALLFLSVGVGSAGVSPSRLVASAFANAYAHRSVHYVSVQRSGRMELRFVGDAATDRGIQRITYRKGRRVGHVTVLVVANTAYVRGDMFTLVNYMRIPPSAAMRWSGKWLSLPASAPGYKAVAAGVRLRSTLDEMKMPGPFRDVGTSTRSGRRVVGVASHVRQAGRRVTEAIYVDPARSLPVEEDGVSGTTISRATLSRWNEPVSLSRPASAIRIQ